MISKKAALVVSSCYFIVELVILALLWASPSMGFDPFGLYLFSQISLGVLFLVAMVLIAIPIVDGILYYFGKSKGKIVSKAANIGENMVG